MGVAQPSPAQLSSPSGVAVDAAGNVYIADFVNHRVRKVSPAGVITTLAGTGETGGAPVNKADPYFRARSTALFVDETLQFIRNHPDNYDPEFEAVFQKLVDRLEAQANAATR